LNEEKREKKKKGRNVLDFIQNIVSMVRPSRGSGPKNSLQQPGMTREGGGEQILNGVARSALTQGETVSTPAGRGEGKRGERGSVTNLFFYVSFSAFKVWFSTAIATCCSTDWQRRVP